MKDIKLRKPARQGRLSGNMGSTVRVNYAVNIVK
jgi:hypothetical protein